MYKRQISVFAIYGYLNQEIPQVNTASDSSHTAEAAAIQSPDDLDSAEASDSISDSENSGLDLQNDLQMPEEAAATAKENNTAPTSSHGESDEFSSYDSANFKMCIRDRFPPDQRPCL